MLDSLESLIEVLDIIITAIVYRFEIICFFVFGFQIEEINQQTSKTKGEIAKAVRSQPSIGRRLDGW